MCGKPLKGKAYKVKLDKAEMLLCRSCAHSYASKIIEVIDVSNVRPETPKHAPVLQRRRQRKPWKPRRILEDVEIVEDYSERIRRAREEMGFTREILARMVGEKESVIKKIEDGKLVPTIDLARKLERVLKINLLEASSEEYYLEEGEEEYALTLGDIVEFKDET